HRQRDGELKQTCGHQNDVTRGDDAEHERCGCDGSEPIPSTDASLPFADHRRRQPEAGAAEDADRQQLTHVPCQDDLLVTIENVEGEQEDEGEQIAVDKRHLVPVVQHQADPKLLKGCVHWRCRDSRYSDWSLVSARNTSSSLALRAWSSSTSIS